MAVIRWMVCQVFLVSSIGIHYIDFMVAISQGCEDDSTCVGGESVFQPQFLIR